LEKINPTNTIITTGASVIVIIYRNGSILIFKGNVYRYVFSLSMRLEIELKI